MIILILIASITAILGALLIGRTPTTSWKRFICQMGAGILLLCGSFCFICVTIMGNTSAETRNAIKVATIETNINIYQDIESGEYFRLLHDNWNIFDMYDRDYIDAEDAKKIIEVSEIISSWDN